MDMGAVVTATEIARIAGVGPAAVSNWRRRHPDFPAPIGGTASSPQFSLEAVTDWLRSQGKKVAVPLAEEVWRRLEALRDPARPGAVLVSAGLALLGDAAEASLPEAVDLKPLPEDVLSSLRALRSESGASEAMEELLSYWVDAHFRQTEVTPKPLATLMAELVSPDGAALAGPVFDPACGTGSLLMAAVEVGAPVVLGQDIDPELAGVAALRLLLDARAEASVASGDALLADAFDLGSAWAALCNPPFGQREWGRDELGYDARWGFGLPPTSEPELAWLQHTLAHVVPGGHAAILMPPAAAARPSGRRIRAELVRQGALRAVIAMPPGAAAAHALGVHLWLLRAPDPDNAETGVLFVDVEQALDGEGGRSSRQGMNWSLVRETVLPHWRAHQSGLVPSSLPGLCHTVSAADLLTEDVDLTPLRNIPTDEELPADQGLLAVDREVFLAKLAVLAAGLPEVAPAEEELRERGETPTVTLESLVRVGTVSLWRGGSRRDRGTADRDQGTADTVDLPVLSLREAILNEAPSGRTADDSAAPIEEGDVLLLGGAAEGARLASPAEVGAVPGPGITVLRPDPQVLDSWFLAGCLAASTNSRRTTRPRSTGSRSTRLDTARLRIPVLPLRRQQSVAAVFRQLSSFSSALADAEQFGQETARRLADALAAGTVRPASDTGPDRP
jgi:hypothetical protein